MPNPSTLEMQQELNERRAETLNVLDLFTSNPILVKILMRRETQKYRAGYCDALFHVCVVSLIITCILWGI